MDEIKLKKEEQTQRKTSLTEPDLHELHRQEQEAMIREDLVGHQQKLDDVERAIEAQVGRDQSREHKKTIECITKLDLQLV